ncbi:MAG: NRDE family protein [Flavobacteriaceae bacterium]|nr:NRDE family protein [Flavobacteriaceae bacterium]
MCTVSFFPKENGGFILTSNRDESPNRNTIPPEIYSVEGVKLLFPKDEKAGGTWIGLSDKKRLICLLNGGFEAHIPKQKYRLSRGVIVTKLLTSDDAVSEIENFNFNDIEPFTIILVDYKEKLFLYELVWDGITKHFSEKPLAPIIWSSSLLYSTEIKKKRTFWFSEFLKEHQNPSEAAILNFHKTAGEGNKKTNIVMDRGFVRTKSITKIKKEKNQVEMNYEDLQSHQKKTIKI